MPYTNTHKHRTSYFKSALTFLGTAKRWKSIYAARQNRKFLLFLYHQYHQRVWQHSLVWLEHAVPPTNAKFKLLFLPTQAGMPFRNIHKHRTSYFKFTLTFLGPAALDVHFFSPTKTINFYDLFIIIINHYQLLEMGFHRVY